MCGTLAPIWSTRSRISKHTWLRRELKRAAYPAARLEVRLDLAGARVVLALDHHLEALVVLLLPRDLEDVVLQWVKGVEGSPAPVLNCVVAVFAVVAAAADGPVAAERFVLRTDFRTIALLGASPVLPLVGGVVSLLLAPKEGPLAPLGAASALGHALPTKPPVTTLSSGAKYAAQNPSSPACTHRGVGCSCRDGVEPSCTAPAPCGRSRLGAAGVLATTVVSASLSRA